MPTLSLIHFRTKSILLFMHLCSHKFTISAQPPKDKQDYKAATIFKPAHHAACPRPLELKFHSLIFAFQNVHKPFQHPFASRNQL
ncbi:hypothetical protein BT63DRAFT_55374 [Microthyrium microscopicum]|uniref:Secreted protein n=1 Tax=Microthyrium microscopicum TaxID=703497 RepID=A0A6A6U4T0_9PEZI|nr:hypothetical protein BT63DRAFT_55374 [Microthyrium microscopicum]